jgi:hypothetical protein
MMGTMIAHVAPTTTKASVNTWMKLCRKFTAARASSWVRTSMQHDGHHDGACGTNNHTHQRQHLDETLQQI